MAGVPLAPYHDFRGPRSDYVRRVALETTDVSRKRARPKVGKLIEIGFLQVWSAMGAFQDKMSLLGKTTARLLSTDLLFAGILDYRLMLNDSRACDPSSLLVGGGFDAIEDGSKAFQSLEATVQRPCMRCLR
ncbi:hypothetical protein TNCV_70241 [Trichonephila clavipes]|nr:hypothetical protein TNCV_70241 [Trichonephila clavipes]